MRFVHVSALWLAIAGCAPAAPVPTPASALPTTVVTFRYGPYVDWGTLIADAACSGARVRFEGSGYTGYRHVAFWLQGASQSFFPGQLSSDGRVPGAVLVGESDVVDGNLAFERTFGPAIGPTDTGGDMPLVPGRYGWVVVGDGKSSSYMAVELPARPCLPAAKPAALAVSPDVICSGTAATITGEGFTPGPVVLQLWKRYQPKPGELDTGKAPPEERELATVQADASGHVSFTWTADVVNGGQYELRALDAGRTRLTSLPLHVCP